MPKQSSNFMQTIFLILFFIICFIFIRYIFVKPEPKENLLYVAAVFKNKDKMSEFSQELKKLHSLEPHLSKEYDIQKLFIDQQYLDVFKLYTNNQEQNIQIKKLTESQELLNNIKIEFEYKEDDKTASQSVFIIKIIDIQSKIQNIIKFDNEYNFNYFYFDLQKNFPPESKDFQKQQNKNANDVKDFFTVLMGTNYKYIVEEKYKKYFDISENKDFFLKFSNSNNNKKFESLLSQELFNNEKKEINSHDLSIYNQIIKQVVAGNNNPPHLIAKLKFNNDIYFDFPIFVNNSGYLPIQWPSKLDWSGKLGFYYIWNVLIISIGFFLYIFSYIFGNLGFGIILTTILVRTLSWPIYTKTSTFTLNMSLVQPEIDKIRDKYILKKDPVSIQKMQLETLRVYKKYNIGFLGMFTTFLQIPIFISMLTTLNRFRIPGGIFNLDNKFLDKTPFLGFIKLSASTTNDNDIRDILIKILLSTFVGITMIILNKISFKKPFYLQNKSYTVLNIEEKAKREQTEKSFKIVSYFMVAIMVFAAFNDNVLSLYWLVGNTYTIFQTVFNRQQMEKKYYLLKQKNYE
ncbi:preprotein translocase subunit YidC [Candidatus Phytoplasma mali]|uniref:Preprotein translocase subunit YidC n=1 Tax=Phytoplasma mali (strain AT) TaxID=482235 RepID=B3QZG0_PHYMT|nr:YidC/Oxa1 family membrane protein insertase [Candidatus Phytoplasma mali]CAP18567.1 preprotein translocase subunit YidC [Candidatus Phytoplasma mali]